MSRLRKRIRVRKFQTAQEEQAADHEWWQRLSPEERLIETWRLSEELWRMKGEFNDEPGLCRSVARVSRR